MVHVSHPYQDVHGGLKRFLEKFPDDFVVSADHPFNPHVFLRAGHAASHSGGPDEPLVGRRAKKAGRKSKAILAPAPSSRPSESAPNLHPNARIFIPGEPAPF